MNSQPDAPPNDSALPAAPADPSLIELEAKLKAAIAEMMTAEEVKLPRLIKTIQRLRVALQLTRDLVDNTTSDTAYREMVLLQRMLKGGVDLEPGTNEEDAAVAREKEVTQLGIDVASANRLVQVFEKMTNDPDNTQQSSGIPDDYEPPDA